MPRMHRCLVTVVLLCLGAATANAQPAVAPLVVAQEFLDALSARQWARVGELTEPNSLWEFITKKRIEWKRSAEVREQDFPMPTLAEISGGDSLMPPDVAKYLLKRAIEQRKQWQTRPPVSLLFTLADVETVAQIDSLDDAELWARSLRARDLDYLVRVAARLSGCAEPFGPDSASLMPKLATKRVVLGVAPLSDDDAIALYSETAAGEETPWRGADQFSQMRLRRTPAGWRVVASDAVGNDGHGVGFATSVEGCPGASRRR